MGSSHKKEGWFLFGFASYPFVISFYTLSCRTSLEQLNRAVGKHRPEPCGEGQIHPHADEEV